MHHLDDLRKRVKQAEQHVLVDRIYAHYKNPQQHYKVLAIAIDEKTNEPCVIYQALYGEKLLWVRDVAIWCEVVMYHGESMSRFKLVE